MTEAKFPDLSTRTSTSREPTVTSPDPRSRPSPACFPTLTLHLDRTSSGALLTNSASSKSLTRSLSGTRMSSNLSPSCPISNETSPNVVQRMPSTSSRSSSSTERRSGCDSSLSISDIDSANLLQVTSARSRNVLWNVGIDRASTQASRSPELSSSSGSSSLARWRYGIASGSLSSM